MKRILYSFLMVTVLTVATTLAWADEEKVNDDRNSAQRTVGANTEAGYTGGCEECRKAAIGCTLKDPRAACQPAKPPVEGQSAPTGVKGRR